MQNQKPVIVIVGPTASGKTALAVNIAKRYKTEIISFDSMQIYKQLCISTARPSEQEMKSVRHRMVGFLDVTDCYSVADFINDAKLNIDEIISENKIPVLVGGTGLYIDSLMKGIDFEQTEVSQSLKKKIEKLYSEQGIEPIFEQLKTIDPESAQRIHINNHKRIIRALTVFLSTGKSITEHNELSLTSEKPYNPLYIGITFRNREKLYERINKRVDLMIENGLIDEVCRFYEIENVQTSAQAIGCKELKPYLDRKATLAECVENLKMQTRRYAKRQLTWFRRNELINWLHADEMNEQELLDNAAVLCDNFIGKVEM